jgi:hypothetical protein
MITPKARMTKTEFDQAIEAIRQGHITPREDRVITAATLMMREMCSVPDDFEPTRTQIVEFIDSLDPPYREVLKRVADDIPEEERTVALTSN